MTAKDTYLSLTSALREHALRHAYWKPASGLDEVLANPAKDFDLFVEATQTDVLDRLLSELGWKRFEPQHTGALPGSEHRLFRLETDKVKPALLHLHVHRQLVTGRAPQYERFIPNAECLLEDTREVHGIPVFGAPGAALVLLCRAAFEPKLQAGGGRPSQDTIALVRRELSQATPDDLLTLSRKLWGEQETLERLLENTAPSDAELERAVGIMKQITPRRDTSPALLLKRAARSATDLTRAKASHVPRLTDGPRRGLRGAQHGLIISVVGPDGAGKSTLIHSLTQWLAPLETHYVHLGRGDSLTSALNILARFKWGALRLLGKKPPRSPSVPPSPRSQHSTAEGSRKKSEEVGQYSDLHMAKYAALAERKLYDLERAGRLRSDGAIVITDRYPLGDSLYLDGPKLQGMQVSGWRKQLRDFEARCYAKIFGIQPDILFRLKIDPQECIRRKPDHDPEEVRRKAEAIYAVTPKAKSTIDIDATLPAPQVFAQARLAIWDNL